jgi:hypothetical protein
LIEQQHSGEVARLLAEGLPAFRGVNAFKSQADRPLLTRWYRIDCIAIVDSNHPSLEFCSYQIAYRLRRDVPAYDEGESAKGQNPTHTKSASIIAQPRQTCICQ